MSDRGFVFGCGECPTEFVVDPTLAFSVEGPGCPSCGDWRTSWAEDGIVPDGEPHDGLVATALGWCGCGNPEAVDEAMLAYLDWAASGGTGELPPDLDGSLLLLVLAYLAGAQDWTEHGSALPYAWLTGAGRAARDNLRRRLAVTPPA